MHKEIYLLLLLFFLSGCTTSKNNSSSKQSPASTEFFPSSRMFSSIFIQRAAEYKALCFQAYNAATLFLDHVLSEKNHDRPKAIITDIDETILDNTPNAVHQALLGKDFEQEVWNQWTAKAIADTLAGARTFFKYAEQQGIEVFYVTNRYEQERAATLKNLQKFDFPFADNAHLILRTDVSGKEDRRKKIRETHDIIMLCGDNLSDFSFVFDKQTEEMRTKQVQNNAALFGRKFIVLPNPNYGDWEGALYDYNYNLSPKEKEKIIRKKLKSF